MEEFRITNEERLMIYSALQLQAQAAVESIRTQGQVSGLNYMTDEEINTEKQAVRNEAA